MGGWLTALLKALSQAPNTALAQRLKTEPHAHMAVMAVVFAAIGLTLMLQPSRYANTPSYANLLDIARQQTWSVAYLVAAALKVAAISRPAHRVLAIITHTVAITLVGVWLAAFIIRWLTDDGTTVVNVSSWSVYLYLVVRSALAIDTQPAQAPPANPP